MRDLDGVDEAVVEPVAQLVDARGDLVELDVLLPPVSLYDKHGLTLESFVKEKQTLLSDKYLLVPDIMYIYARCFEQLRQYNHGKLNQRRNGGRNGQDKVGGKAGYRE